MDFFKEEKRTDLVERIVNLGESQKSVGERLGVSRSTIQRAIKKPSKYENIILNIERALDEIEEEKPLMQETTPGLEEPQLERTDEGTIVRKKDGTMAATVVTTKNPANLSIDQIVELFDLDKDLWECTGFTAKSWNTSMKDKDKKPMMTRNYSVKASFKPIINFEPTPKDIRWVFEEASDLYNELETVIPEVVKNNTGNTLVLPIFDAHIGKLSWGEESGENYDIKIAVKRFRRSVRSLVTRANVVGFDHIIFPIGNDFFQYDGMFNETTKGTKVDSDIRWKKLFRVGINLLRDSINFCSEHAEVDVILVQGNHDNAMSFYAFEALRGWYDEHPLVSIDEDIKTRTYRKIGINLLGFTHGDKERDRIYKLMQQEARELWGQTKYSEWIIGHYHRSFVDEQHGVTKRVVNSLSGTDAWHYEQGFVGSLKASQGIIYNENHLGPLVIFFDSVNVEEELEQK